MLGVRCAAARAHPVDRTHGYLGYVAVMVTRNFASIEVDPLRFFEQASFVGAILGALALLSAWVFFARPGVGHTPMANRVGGATGATRTHATS